MVSTPSYVCNLMQCFPIIFGNNAGRINNMKFFCLPQDPEKNCGPIYLNYNPANDVDYFPFFNS